MVLTTGKTAVDDDVGMVLGTETGGAVSIEEALDEAFRRWYCLDEVVREEEVGGLVRGVENIGVVFGGDSTGGAGFTIIAEEYARGTVNVLEPSEPFEFRER